MIRLLELRVDNGSLETSILVAKIKIIGNKHFNASYWSSNRDTDHDTNSLPSFTSLECNQGVRFHM